MFMEKSIGPRRGPTGIGPIRPNGWSMPPKLVNEFSKRLTMGSGLLRQDHRRPRILSLSNAYPGVDFIPVVLVILEMLGLLRIP